MRPVPAWAARMYMPGLRALELAGARESFRRQPAGLGPDPHPFGKFRRRADMGPSCRILPGKAFCQNEGPDVANAAILVALQAHALAAGHLRNLDDGENQHLPVEADHRDMIAG